MYVRHNHLFRKLGIFANEPSLSQVVQVNDERFFAFFCAVKTMTLQLHSWVFK